MCEESFDVIPIFNWVNLYFIVKVDTFGKAIIVQKFGILLKRSIQVTFHLFGFIKILIGKKKHCS